MMMAEYEGHRAQQKQYGPTYRCGHCTLTFPAEAFDVDRHDIDDLYNMCIGMGALRVCSACMQIPDGTSTSLCRRCKQQRQLEYFSAESDICSACQLQEKYAFRACSSCHKAFQINQLRENSEGRRMCHECAPEAWPYRCTACTRHKPASEFRHCRRDLESAYHALQRLRNMHRVQALLHRPSLHGSRHEAVHEVRRSGPPQRMRAMQQDTHEQ